MGLSIFNWWFNFVFEGVAVGQQKSFLINTTGSFRISGGGGGGGGSRAFFQNFVVTEEGGKWKVASDVFRTQVSPNQAVI